MTEPQMPKAAGDAGASPGAGQPRDSLTELNAKTARRQHLLLAGIGGLLLAGASWIFLGSSDAKKDPKAAGAETIETAGLVNRDLSQREFVSVYGNRLDNVTRDQKALKDSAANRSDRTTSRGVRTCRTRRAALESMGQACPRNTQ